MQATVWVSLTLCAASNPIGDGGQRKHGKADSAIR